MSVYTVGAVLARDELRGLTPAAPVSDEEFSRMLSEERPRFNVRRVRRKGLERACRGKVAYGRRSARRAARIMRDAQGDDVRMYACPFCSRFHVGHPPAGVEV